MKNNFVKLNYNGISDSKKRLEEVPVEGIGWALCASSSYYKLVSFHEENGVEWVKPLNPMYYPECRDEIKFFLNNKDKFPILGTYPRTRTTNDGTMCGGEYVYLREGEELSKTSIGGYCPPPMGMYAND